MIELITNQSKKLQKLEGTILKQDEKLNSFNNIISGELFNQLKFFDIVKLFKKNIFVDTTNNTL